MVGVVVTSDMQLDLATLRDFAARYTAAWCSRDPANVAVFYSPDGSLTVNNGTTAIGRKAISDVAQSFMSAFPDIQVLMNDVLLKNDRVEYYWTLIGTNTGPGGQGSRDRITGYEEWKIGPNGLITSSHGHFDSAEYQRQLASGPQE